MAKTIFFPSLYMGGSLQLLLSNADFATVAHAFPTSRLNYGDVLHMRLHLKYIQKMKNDAEFICGFVKSSHHDYITVIFHALCWLLSFFQMELKMLALVYAALQWLSTTCSVCMHSHWPFWYIHMAHVQYLPSKSIAKMPTLILSERSTLL